MIGLGAVYGGTGRLTAANLAIGLNAMMQRTDVMGNLMAISSVWLVIPKVLEIQAAVILESALMAGTPNPAPRFVAGPRATIPYNSRLPVVVMVPEGCELHYRIWRADPEFAKAASR